VVKHCIVAENVVVSEGAQIGEMPEDGRKGVATIGSGVTIGKNAKMGADAMVSENVKDGEVV
jgi:glucose-1-phosphate adenylyltransferase